MPGLWIVNCNLKYEKAEMLNVQSFTFNPVQENMVKMTMGIKQVFWR